MEDSITVKSGEKRMQEIDIEKIMQEIRADIQKKGYTADMLSFTDVPMRSKECLANQAGDVYSGLADLPRRMRERSRINWKRPVPAGLKGFVKKIIYKCTGFVVAPIAEEQTAYNKLAALSVKNICLEIKKEKKGMHAMEKRIAQMERRILSLEQKIDNSGNSKTSLSTEKYAEFDGSAAHGKEN